MRIYQLTFNVVFHTSKTKQGGVIKFALLTNEDDIESAVIATGKEKAINCMQEGRVKNLITSDVYVTLLECKLLFEGEIIDEEGLNMKELDDDNIWV